MTDLIRNCAHHSTHQTLIDTGPSSHQSKTIKTTFSADGVAGIQAEFDGLSWYASRLGKDTSALVLAFRATTGYARLETPYVSGTVVPMPADPNGLIHKLNAAVESYLAVIWEGPNTPSHGDYSLSNHVFNNAEDVLRIIDWEHFNRDLPAQYDPLYMIVEPFLFWVANGKAPKTECIGAAKSCIAKLKIAISLPENAITEPASWLQKMAEAHRAVWGDQAAKVPFLNAVNHRIAAVDKLLGTKQSS